jgi:hypothetical protein
MGLANYDNVYVCHAHLRTPPSCHGQSRLVLRVSEAWVALPGSRVPIQAPRNADATNELGR